MQVICEFVFRKITPGLFRLILACTVMVYHSVSFLTIGHYAVYVFFILSGYWVFKMYKEKYSKYANSYWIYLQSRFFRLLPTYWLILIFSILVYMGKAYFTDKIDYSFLTLSNLIRNALVLGISNSHRQFLVPAWSLDIEAQFYITAPVFLMVGLQRKGILYLLFISVASFVFIVLSSTMNVWSNFFMFLPFFLLGGVIYLYNIKFSASFAGTCLLIAATILSINYLSLFIKNGYLFNKQAVFYVFSYQETLNVILTLLTVPFITVNVRQPSVGSKDGLLSSMSYVIYLLHWPLLQIYAMTVLHVTMLQKYTCIFIYYMTCLFLSWVFSAYVDAHFESKRRIWLRKQVQKHQIAILT
jgi:peptidoglycan/LPS O-acetylase OafA/YrhL